MSKYWLGQNPGIYFYTSEVSATSASYPTSLLAGTGEIKLYLKNAAGTAVNLYLPLAAVAAS
jgi:hypothetical protein